MKKRIMEFRASIYQVCRETYVVGIVLGMVLLFVSVWSFVIEAVELGAVLMGLGILCFVPVLFAYNPNPEVKRIADAWAEAEARENRKKAEEKRKARKQATEQKQEQEQKMLAYTFGLDKFCAMDVADAAADTAKAEEYERGLKAMRELNMITLTSTYQERERDWAVWGGLADGIAGPGAGIATAMDIMRENDQIRERNAARRTAAAKQYSQLSDLERKAAEKKPRARRAVTLKEVKKEYVASFTWSPIELLDMLSPFTGVKTEIDKLTKSVTVTAKWKRAESAPNIDGAIRAKLYTTENQYAGCAYLVLPKTGATKKTGTVTGICATPVPSEKYEVKFEPVNLWELEIKKKFKPRTEGCITAKAQQKIVEKIEADFQKEVMTVTQ